MSKNICFFNSSKTWGGGEKWHFDIALQLHPKNYNVSVITNKKSEFFKKIKSTNLNVKSICITNLSFLNIFKILKLKNEFQKQKIETIILNLPSDLKIAGISAKLAGVQNIIYRRGSAIAIKNSWLNRFIFKNIVTCVIANSEETKKTILQNNFNLISSEKIHVIYNGINIEEFDKSESIEIFKKQHNELIIGNLGRMVFQKNQTFLIDVAQKLKEKNIQFKLLIAGIGDLENSLKSKTKELNLENEIVFTGFVKNPKSFMNSIDIFLLPSRWEGFGYVLLEAMLCKKPSIAFNLSSNPELIENNKTGFLINENDIDEFVEKIIFLIQNQEIAKQFGENARLKAEYQFDIKQTINKLEQII